MKTKEKATEKQYHVFTDHKDEYVSTLKEAKCIFNQFKADYDKARCYVITETTEDCILSYGDYPY